MCKPVVLLVLALSMSLLATAGASADVGCRGLGHSELVYAPLEPVSVFTLPDGSGWSLAEARSLGACRALDARIQPTFIDWCDQRLANLPAEDLWLETSAGGLVVCPGGAVADGPTDALGRTQWSRPLHAGGHSDRAGGERTRIYVAGEPGPWLLEILFNSPDIDGDLHVDLTDTVLFAVDLTNGYEYRSDFWPDERLNLSDLAMFVRAIGAACP